MNAQVFEIVPPGKSAVIFPLLISWRRVLVLPKRDGSVVLLSPARPDALLQAMQRTAG